MSISTFTNTYFHLYQFVYCPYIIIAFQFNSDILLITIYYGYLSMKI